MGHKAVWTAHLPQKSPDLCLGENHWEPFWLFGAFEVRYLVPLRAEHAQVEEQKGI